MTAVTKASVKAYFETGDKPTQAQFEDLIDSYEDASQVLVALSAAVSASTSGIAYYTDASTASMIGIGSAGRALVSAGTKASAVDFLINGGSAGLAIVSASTQASVASLIGSASETAAGVIEIATTAETTAGTDTTRAVTPATLAVATGATFTSWTPAITFATPGNLNVAYSTQVGRYVKNGDTVTLWFTIVTSTFTHSSASGTFRITGLPFTSANVSGLTYNGMLGWAGITKASYTQVNLSLAANSDVILLSIYGSGQAEDNVDTADMPTGGTVVLRGQLTYQAA